MEVARAPSGHTPSHTPAATPTKARTVDEVVASPPYRPFEPRTRVRMARDVAAGFATLIGVLVMMLAYRVGCSFNASACAGFVAAGGHTYAYDSGAYDRLTWRGLARVTVRTLRGIAEVVVENYSSVCIVLFLIFFLRATMASTVGDGGGGTIRATRIHPSDAVMMPQVNRTLTFEATYTHSEPPLPHVDRTLTFEATYTHSEPSPPPSPPAADLKLDPGADYLTHEQAQQLHLELLAGNAVPPKLPRSITHTLAIGDTGCARSMGNHSDQFKKGSIYEHESDVSGAAGAFKTRERGEMALPMGSNVGVRLWSEKDSIVNTQCAYILLAIGRASREQGLSLHMPGGGGDCTAQFPNGVIITFFNRDVLVLRPLGYKPSPERALSAINELTLVQSLKVPASGDFILYLGSGPLRHDDLTNQSAAVDLTASIVLLDPVICPYHDLTRVDFKDAVVSQVGARCRGVIVSIRCKTWSAATWLKDAAGNPGRPWRDVDHLHGVPRDGKIPRAVLDSDLESEHAVAIGIAVRAAGGFLMGETPCRRTGPKAHPRHVLTDCAKAVHMLDHPAWVRFAESEGMVELIWDQCKKATVPADSPIKSSIWFCTPDIAPHIINEFGKPPQSLCDHPAGTHKALRGVDSSGQYLTSATRSENYSGGINLSIARSIKSYLWSVDEYPSLDELAAVAGVIRGKTLPRHAVTHQFIHDTYNHSEARVLKHLHHALCDVPEWWCEVIDDKPCEACLRGNAKLLGPTGSLPTDEGLLFLDIHHVTVKEIFTGFNTTVGGTHANTGHCKSVRVGSKGDAHEAIELMLCYYNAQGRPITWLHADNAWELKGTKVVMLCRSKNIRITTTTVDSSRKNRQEPQWAANMAVTRKYIERGKAPYNLCGWAWDHAEEGRMLTPSRESPHDCALGRLLSKDGQQVKPPGTFRRPWLCLCYPTIAPRLPSGTLVNKVAAQSKRALHLGYIGGRSGSFERLGMDHTQAGYACYIPDENRILVTSDVSFIPTCFPGLARTSRGGWTIPDDAIPFVERDSSQPDTAKQGTTDGDRLEDIDQEKLEAMQHPQDEATLELRRGFPPELDVETSDHASGRGGDESEAPGRGGRDASITEDAATTTAAEPPPPPIHYLIPHSHWPDEVCDEHDGKGWEVTVVKREREWALCRFASASDESGKPYGDVWRRFRDLIILGESTPEVNNASQLTKTPPPPPTPQTSEVSHVRQVAQGITSIPSLGPYDEPVPNEHTVPPPGSDDAIRDPVRPERARRPPERLGYASSAMAAAYVECSQANFDLHSPRLSDAAFHVNTTDGADRLVGRAFELSEHRGEVFMFADEVELRGEFDASPIELQRAVMIATDFDRVSEEFGHTSPQATLTRELYAVAALDAASHGVVVPYLNPLVHVASGPAIGSYVKPSDLFDEAYSGCLLQSGDVLLGNEMFALSKMKTSPDIFSERQMRDARWDTPKQLEVAKIERLEAKSDVAADDPKVLGMPICEMMWTGRCKRNPDGTVLKLNARSVGRGDLDKGKVNLTSNDTTSPTARTSSNLAFDAVACLRAQHKCDYDVPGAYLQGDQLAHEQRLYRPPVGFRKWDERGVEILWLTNHPFYGQSDAGAIWNRTINTTFTSSEPPHGCGLERCAQDPSLYSTNVSNDELGGQVNNTLYVDDGRLAWDDGKPAVDKANDVKAKLADRYGITFGPDDPEETHFLGANIFTDKSRRVASVKATSYIDLQVKRYADGDVSPCKRFPAHWSQLPADETLVRAWESATASRAPATPELTKRYGSLFGSLLHAVKFRPEISCALGLCGSCLTFPTEEMYECLMHVLVYLGRSRKLGTTYSAHVEFANHLRAFADANWSLTRSTTGYAIMLAGAAIVSVSRRQHCITMSSCESELVALCDLAIELLHIIEVVRALGHDITEAVEVHTDSKAAYDLCHRFTSAQNSRHVDRKLFKMRELRGAGRVVVRHIPGETNPADLFTKILTRQTFEKHRRTVLNSAGSAGAEAARDVASQRDGIGAP